MDGVYSANITGIEKITTEYNIRNVSLGEYLKMFCILYLLLEILVKKIGPKGPILHCRTVAVPKAR